MRIISDGRMPPAQHPCNICCSTPLRIRDSADLDDLRVAADEIQEHPPAGVNQETVKRLKRALSDATDAADDMEEEMN
jgi:hypothetical protein